MFIKLLLQHLYSPSICAPVFLRAPATNKSPVCPDWSALSGLRKQRPLCYHISSTGVFKMPRPFWGRGWLCRCDITRSQKSCQSFNTSTWLIQHPELLYNHKRHVTFYNTGPLNVSCCLFAALQSKSRRKPHVSDVNTRETWPPLCSSDVHRPGPRLLTLFLAACGPLLLQQGLAVEGGQRCGGVLLDPWVSLRQRVHGARRPVGKPGAAQASV